MKTNRETIIDNLKKTRELLTETLLWLEFENQDGRQFDYVNSPRLSDNFDAINRTVKQIEKIIYQE